MREYFLLSLHSISSVYGWDPHWAIQSQCYSAQRQKRNSGMLTGNTSRSRIVPSSFVTKSKLFFNAGILKTSLVFFAYEFRFQNFLSFSPHSALKLTSEIEHYQLWILHLFRIAPFHSSALSSFLLCINLAPFRPRC